VNFLTLVILIEHFNRFRWVFCQLETLRHCLPPSVRHTLDELPESLDETYERVLKEIKKPNRIHAHRLLQCLVVAIRPLSVEELAEILAVDFDDAEGIPKLKPNWRWADEEQALLTSCSSLITIVETYSSRVVQFSHFSVKEFLTSERCATSSVDVSRYHIDLEPAHTILAQACMGVLLQLDDQNGIEESPLAGYVAEHWVMHAQFKRVSSILQKAMEYLFDLDRPYFASLHDTDPFFQESQFKKSQLMPPSSSENETENHITEFTISDMNSEIYQGDGTETTPSVFSCTPLYCAALCGFRDLVEHLVVKYPQHMNTNSGYYVTPMFAALANRHFQTASLLFHNGAHVDAHGGYGMTSLHSAAWNGDLEMVQVLLDYKVDANTRGFDGGTPLHGISDGFPLMRTPHTRFWPDVARLLLEHGADVNARTYYGSTPLHVARVGPATANVVRVIRVLLEHGANIDAEDEEGRAPLHVAMDHEIVHVLLEHGANVGKKDNKGRTPLHVAADHLNFEVVRELLEHGADVGAGDNRGRTPLHFAVDLSVAVIEMTDGAEQDLGSFEIIRALLEHGANVDAEDDEGRTPFQIAEEERAWERVNKATKLLLEYGAKGSCTGHPQGDAQ
jgi:ankyrin repeat protein